MVKLDLECVTDLGETGPALSQATPTAKGRKTHRIINDPLDGDQNPQTTHCE